MRKTLIGCGMFVIIATLSGCSSSADGLMNDMIKCMNELADALEKKLPEDKMTAIKTRMDDIGKKLDALKLSDDEKKKLFEKHRDAMTKASQRMATAALGNISNLGSLIPGVPALPKMEK